MDWKMVSMVRLGVEYEDLKPSGFQAGWDDLRRGNPRLQKSGFHANLTPLFERNLAKDFTVY